jgi:hypothetical protein
MHSAAGNGAPPMVGEEKTRDVFGDYVSIQNMKPKFQNHMPEQHAHRNNLPPKIVKTGSLISTQKKAQIHRRNLYHPSTA